MYEAISFRGQTILEATKKAFSWLSDNQRNVVVSSYVAERADGAWKITIYFQGIEGNAKQGK